MKNSKDWQRNSKIFKDFRKFPKIFKDCQGIMDFQRFSKIPKDFQRLPKLSLKPPKVSPKLHKASQTLPKASPNSPQSCPKPFLKPPKLFPKPPQISFQWFFRFMLIYVGLFNFMRVAPAATSRQGVNCAGAKRRHTGRFEINLFSHFLLSLSQN